MDYELPPGVRSAQDLRFPDAVKLPKPVLVGCQGAMMAMGPNQGSVLSYRCKKWGNGANNSRPAKQKDGAGHGMRSSKELSNKNAK
jgi:hypothetical protein